tara:strand:+ start:5632 stop:6390 length:759 start_codon:yes stop_codon:yes gene_type:complete
MQKKVAIGFFGITRSLKLTRDSIYKNVIGRLEELGYAYTIFLHTYELNNYKNIRTKESCTNMDNEEYKLLKPDYFVIEKQDIVIDGINPEKYRTHKDPWNTNYNSVDNFLLGQYSKMKLTDMIEKSQINFDYIMFLRPDVMYLHPLEYGFFNNVVEKKISIPKFGTYKPSRPHFNDRFAITNQETYKIYGKVFNELFEISKKEPLHSETVLTKYLTKNGIKYKYIHFVFKRIRIDGSVDPHDRKLRVRSKLG